MHQKIKPTELSQIIESGGIYTGRLLDGMERYPGCILQETEQGYETVLYKFLELNGEGHAFFDFYFRNLESAARDALTAELPADLHIILNRIDYEAGIYFPLTKAEVPLINYLNTREYLFSTFYFTKYPCIIWGNYEMRNPILFKNKEIQMFYRTHQLLNNAEPM